MILQHNAATWELLPAYVCPKPLGLIFAGLASSVTAAMTGGCVFAGIYREPFDMARQLNGFRVELSDGD